MIQKTHAIVLRFFSFSRTSHVVYWLTESGELIKTVIKGARRPKSAFLGQYDLFYTCELLYYTQEHNGVHYARECTPLDFHSAFRTNWRAEHCASWFSALACYATENQVRSHTLYQLLRESLNYLDHPSNPPSAAVFARFEIQILQLCGLSPNLSPCSLCPPPSPETLYRFNLASGALACPQHNPQTSGDPLIPISARTLALYQTLLNTRSIGLQSPVARIQSPELYALLRFLGLFIRYHLVGIPIEGRAVVLRSLIQSP